MEPLKLPPSNNKPDRVAQVDQACKESEQMARMVAAFYKRMRSEEVDVQTSRESTLMWAEKLIKPEAYKG